MKVVTKYVCDYDGKEFDADYECFEYEKKCGLVEQTMKALEPRKLRETSFLNGEGYIQHDKDAVISARNNMYVLSLLFCGECKSLREAISSAVSNSCSPNNTIVSRWISDSNSDYYRQCFNRFLCIDDQGREWGQPYFANNPHEAKQVQLN